MSIDEMELVRRLGDVEHLPDEAFEQARTVLHAALALEGTPAVAELAHHPKRRRRSRLVRGEIAAGVAAAVAAAALIATSPGHTPKSPVAAHHLTSRLVRLADFVSGSAAPAGDAALVARTTTGGGNSVTVYDLYGDNGQYFFSQTESGLPGQVSAGHDLADGVFAREVAAAKLAASGDAQTGAQDMADAPDPSNVVSPKDPPSTAATAAKAAALHETPHVGNLFDNWAWENSEDALIAGSGQPQVRAGVLRILATLPGVTVTSGTAGGQPTLVLTSGAAETGPGYTEQLTINADTGVPVSFVGGPSVANPAATVTYQVTRVTLSDVAAGKV